MISPKEVLPMEPCRSMVLGWDFHADDWAQVDCEGCFDYRPSE